MLRLLVESFQSIAEDKGIQLHFRPRPDHFYCLLDRDKLHKIVSNLLTNACKFTPAGGEVTLAVDTAPMGEDQQLVRLRVTDSGLGIAPAEQARIFEPFYQSDNNYLLSSEGSGIGLTLVKELATLMGGSVGVESQLGAGSCFEVVLPLRCQPAEASPSSADESGAQAEAVGGTDAAGEPLPAGTTPLVLLIEDKQALARYIGSCLETQYRLVYAYDGEEGIQAAFRYTPDLIITDWMMPLRDGLEVIDTLKRDPRTSHIPMLLLTARAEIADRLRGLRVGADAYLSKPFAEEELVLTLGNLSRLQASLRKRYALLPYRPADDGETDSLSPEDEFVAKAQTFFMDNLSNSGLSMEALYRHLAMSHTQVHRKLLALTGRTPLQWLRELRLQRAQQLLQEGRLTIGEIADRCGFADAAYFSRVFARAFGVPPSAWREKTG